MKSAPLLALARKEWREIVRDRMFLLLAFVLPVQMMVVFGYGINQETEKIPLLIVDQDRSAASRGYADRYIQQRTFSFVGYADHVAQAERALADGSARVALVIPPGFAEALGDGRARAQTLVDGTLAPNTTRTLEGYLEATSAAIDSELHARALSARLGIDVERAFALLSPIRLEIRHLYNPDLVSQWFMAPALIMFVLIFVAPMLTALSVVREKETGSIYNVASSTLPRLHFLLGKLLPTVAITMINTAVLWALATGLFGAPFRGSLAFFALGSLLYVVCITGLGLLLSLLVRTQVAAMIIAVMISNVIGTQYSGMLRPISSLSGVPWWLAHLTPPMYYLEIVHGTFLKGLGASELWQEALVLFVYAAVVLAASFLLFRKRTRV